MRKMLVVLTILVAAGACTPGYRQYSAPAPENALDCALGQTSQMGYFPMAGGKADGYIKVQGPASPTMGERAALGDAPETNHLTITNAAGQLRIRVDGITGKNAATKPSAKGDADAKAILSACGIPS